MSSGSQHKMYGYEVTPPPGVWDKIAAELDESGLSGKFPSLLYNTQVMPPARIWQAIAATLDESAFMNDYSMKLSGIAVTPPVRAWDKIRSSLDQPAATTGSKRSIFPLLKYAAAAAIIAFLVWGGIQLSGKKPGNETATADGKVIPVPPSQRTNPPVITPDKNMAVADMNAALEEARNDAALEASKKTYAKLDVGVKRSKVKNAADFIFLADDYDYAPISQSRSVGPFIEPEEMTPIDMAKRYIVLMTPDGNIIRMSKKLSNLVCCVSGEEMDKDCIKQMKNWREKIASPSAMHSPGNFLDILNLVHSLQDN